MQGLIAWPLANVVLALAAAGEAGFRPQSGASSRAEAAVPNRSLASGSGSYGGHGPHVRPRPQAERREFQVRKGWGRSAGPRELVVLVHGMGRTHLSMQPMARTLEEDGFDVLNWGYQSRTRSVPQLGARLAERIETATADGDYDRVHLVGHSLGNILIRWVLANRLPENLGRIVMLAPPNRGSRVADHLAPWLSWFLKPLPDLTSNEGSAARSIPTPPDVEIGVIAGARDHKVRVEETFLEGQTDHAVVPGGHTFIMTRRVVRDLTVRFLREGRFSGAPLN